MIASSPPRHQAGDFSFTLEFNGTHLTYDAEIWVLLRHSDTPLRVRLETDPLPRARALRAALDPKELQELFRELLPEWEPQLDARFAGRLSIECNWSKVHSTVNGDRTKQTLVEALATVLESL